MEKRISSIEELLDVNGPIENTCIDINGLNDIEKKEFLKILLTKKIEEFKNEFLGFDFLNISDIDYFFNNYSLNSITLEHLRQITNVLGIDVTTFLSDEKICIEQLFLNESVDEDFLEKPFIKSLGEIRFENKENLYENINYKLKSFENVEDKKEWLSENSKRFPECMKNGVLIYSEYLDLNELKGIDVCFDVKKGNKLLAYDIKDLIDKGINVDIFYSEEELRGRRRGRTENVEEQEDDGYKKFLRELKDDLDFYDFLLFYKLKIFNRNNLEYWIGYNHKISDLLNFSDINVNLKIDNASVLSVEDIEKLKQRNIKVTNINFEYSIDNNNTISDLLNFSDMNVNLKIDNASVLSVEDIEKLEQRNIKITNIKIKPQFNENFYSHTDYELEDYKKCRKELDELVEGLNPNEYSQIELFLNVIERIVTQIIYDEDAAYGSEEVQEQKRKTSRNLIGGLLEHKCVCAGYAEILRNALAMVGIKSIYVGSELKLDKRKDEMTRHAFNQVEIDDDWYYVDPTWMRNFFIKDKHKEILEKLLCNKETFEEWGEEWHCARQKMVCYDTVYSGKRKYGVEIEEFLKERENRIFDEEIVLDNGDTSEIIKFLKNKKLISEYVEICDDSELDEETRNELKEAYKEIVKDYERYSNKDYKINKENGMNFDYDLMDLGLIKRKSKLSAEYLDLDFISKLTDNQNDKYKDTYFDLEDVDSLVYNINTYKINKLDLNLFLTLAKGFDVLPQKICEVLNYEIDFDISSDTTKEDILEFFNNQELMDSVGNIKIDRKNDSEPTLFDRMVFEKLHEFSNNEERKNFYNKLAKKCDKIYQINSDKLLNSLPLEYQLHDIDMRMLSEIDKEFDSCYEKDDKNI